MVPRFNLIYTAEAAKKAGISKATLLRWLKDGKIPEVARDVRGWRVFTQEEVTKIDDYAHKIIPPNPKAKDKQRSVKR
jgi:predicted site-specific integrase-resolvase